MGYGVIVRDLMVIVDYFSLLPLRLNNHRLALRVAINTVTLACGGKDWIRDGQLNKINSASSVDVISWPVLFGEAYKLSSSLVS